MRRLALLLLGVALAGTVAAPARAQATGRAAVYQRTALGQAAFRGKVDDVRAALEGGADVNERDPFGATALVYASLGGHVEVVQALLAAGADPNLITSGGDASVLGEVGTVEDLRLRAHLPGATALHHAALAGHVEVVQLLLAAKADVNRARTSAYDRVVTGQIIDPLPGAEAFLATAGIELGDRPLHYAVVRKNEAIVRLLVAAGAALDVRSGAELGYRLPAELNQVRALDALLKPPAPKTRIRPLRILILPPVTPEGTPESEVSVLYRSLRERAAEQAHYTILGTDDAVQALGSAELVTGCADEACARELARSLEADGVIRGRLETVGGSYACTFDRLAVDGELVERFSTTEPMPDDATERGAILVRIGGAAAVALLPPRKVARHEPPKVVVATEGDIETGSDEAEDPAAVEEELAHEEWLESRRQARLKWRFGPTSGFAMSVHDLDGNKAVGVGMNLGFALRKHLTRHHASGAITPLKLAFTLTVGGRAAMTTVEDDSEDEETTLAEGSLLAMMARPGLMFGPFGCFFFELVGEFGVYHRTLASEYESRAGVPDDFERTGTELLVGPQFGFLIGGRERVDIRFHGIQVGTHDLEGFALDFTVVSVGYSF